MGDFWPVVRVETYGHRRSYRSDDGPPTTKTVEIPTCRRHARRRWLLEPDINGQLVLPIHDTAKKEKIAPFSIENSRRKRFMLSFGGKSAWPYTEFQGAGPKTTKKIK